MAGRPTKYDPEYCEQALDFIGEQGKSVTQFAKFLQVSKSTVYLWATEHELFSDALSMAQDWSQAVWEDKLETMMVSKEVNAPLVKLYFANRFRWHDKGEPTEGDESNAQSLNITFDVRDPVKAVKVTNAKPK
jgi:transposase-like protein